MIYFIKTNMITSFFSNFLDKLLRNNIKYVFSTAFWVLGALKAALLRAMTIQSTFFLEMIHLLGPWELSLIHLHLPPPKKKKLKLGEVLEGVVVLQLFWRTFLLKTVKKSMQWKSERLLWLCCKVLLFYKTYLVVLRDSALVHPRVHFSKYTPS